MRSEKAAGGVLIWAIVPAAGLGKRMARPDADNAGKSHKQMLDIHGRPMLTHVIDALVAARTQCVMVVVNQAIADDLRALCPADAKRCYIVNPRPEGEMIESVQLGLAEAFTQHSASGIQHSAGFLICPGDHPCITPQVIDACVERFEQNPSRMVIAAHGRRRGHPMIIPADLAFDVRSWPPSRGLNELRTLHPERVILCDVDDPGVLMDVDTPADLDRARQALSP